MHKTACRVSMEMTIGITVGQLIQAFLHRRLYLGLPGGLPEQMLAVYLSRNAGDIERGQFVQGCRLNKSDTGGTAAQRGRTRARMRQLGAHPFGHMGLHGVFNHYRPVDSFVYQQNDILLITIP